MKQWLVAAGVLFFVLQSTQALCWHSGPHRVIAQIAYDHLSPHAKKTFNHYNDALNQHYTPQNFVNASNWLDELHQSDVYWFSTMHYLSWFFTEDGSPLPASQEVNAIWAVEEAIKVLKSPKAGDFDKGLSLRMLIHVLGDLHQPLHVATRVSQKYPEGDRGGNLLRLGKNAIATNLHFYWDSGGGYFIPHRQYSNAQIQQMARQLEALMPCSTDEMDNNPNQWAKESHELAITLAYHINAGDVPDQKYQEATQAISKERMAIAGCRLASLLNQIDLTISKLNRAAAMRTTTSRVANNYFLG